MASNSMNESPGEKGGWNANPLLSAILLVLFALLVWRLADVLLVLFGGIVIAVALRSLASPLERHLPFSSRVAVILVVLMLLAAAALGAWLIGGRVAEQVSDLQKSIPRALGALVDWLNNHSGGMLILRAWENATEGDVPWSRLATAASLTLA